MRATTFMCLTLVSLAPQLSTSASEPAKESGPQGELARIAYFFEFEDKTKAEPAVLGRTLKYDMPGTPTLGGVIVDGSVLNIYHTLEKTPKGLRLQISAVHDTVKYGFDDKGARVKPGESIYRIEVEVIELKSVEGGSRVEGYLRDISNSRFDPVGWSVEISDVRVIEQDDGKRGTLIWKERQVGTVGTFAKDNKFIPTASEAEVVLKLNKDGKLVRTDTVTSYNVNPETGVRTKVQPDPKKNIQNPEIYIFQEK